MIYLEMLPYGSREVNENVFDRITSELLFLSPRVENTSFEAGCGLYQKLRADWFSVHTGHQFDGRTDATDG